MAVASLSSCFSARPNLLLCNLSPRPKIFASKLSLAYVGVGGTMFCYNGSKLRILSFSVLKRENFSYCFDSFELVSSYVLDGFLTI